MEEAIKVIHSEVNEYCKAENALIDIAAAEALVDAEFEEELQKFDSLKKKIAMRLQTLLDERGVEEGSKHWEDVQKAVRKRLFEPMTVVVDGKHDAVDGKIYKQEAFEVTLVEQASKMVPNTMLDQQALQEAHKQDVQEFINAGLYSFLSIDSKNAASFVEARQKSGNPLKSVVLERSGYCKVKIK